jgi:hypothetical protein
MRRVKPGRKGQHVLLLLIALGEDRDLAARELVAGVT